MERYRGAAPELTRGFPGRPENSSEQVGGVKGYSIEGQAERKNYEVEYSADL